jgi:hypothetical protein
MYSYSAEWVESLDEGLKVGKFWDKYLNVGITRAKHLFQLTLIPYFSR